MQDKPNMIEANEIKDCKLNRICSISKYSSICKKDSGEFRSDE